MSPIRRLHGIAALSAAALASTSIAGPAWAADDENDACFPDVCMDDGADQLIGGVLDPALLRQMFQSQGMPDESIDQLLEFYAAMFTGTDAGGTPDVGAMLEAIGGGEVPDDLMNKIELAYGESADPDVLSTMLKYIDPESADALAKYDDLGSDPLAATAKVTDADIDGLLAKVEWEPGAALNVAEAALVQAAAAGDIDRATLEAVLELLPDE